MERDDARHVGMLGIFRAFLVLALGCVVLLSAIPTRADSLYYVAGALTLVGNNACGPFPCTETVDFSFELSEKYNSVYNYYYLTFVPNTSTITASGPLGPLYFAGASGGQFANPESGPGGENANYTAFNSSPAPVFTDSIEIWATENLQPAPFTPGIGGGTLYSCATTTCVTDFCPTDFCTPGTQLPVLAIGAPASVETTVAAVPEPPVVALVPLGLLGLWLLAWCNDRTKLARWHQHKSTSC